VVTGVDAVLLANPVSEADQTEGIDHYDRSAFDMVKVGDVLGKVIPPVAGEDGIDVTGRSLAARSGKPARLLLDDSILTDAAGNLIAQRDGVLSVSGDRASVSDLLDIPEYVDFSTGHVDFPGEVHVHRGVRDLFRVTASGGITVDGLIESAQIESGGIVRARGGMAGRGRGELLARGDLEARYISGFTCQVLGSLGFDKEIIDSRVEVQGDVESGNGSIIGGSLTVVGSIKVGALGAPSECVTRVTVGSVPTLEPRLFRLEALVGELTERCGRDQDELRALSAPGRRLSGPEKERFTELNYAVQTGLISLGKAEQARERVRQVVAGLSTVDVSVAGEVYPGVVFRLGGTDFRVRNRLKGPIRMTRSAAGELVLRQGDRAWHATPVPTAQWCDRRAAA
ncbi:MAG: FapA family protein, partial [Phycisphaerales bacterium]